ncbi:hypothetical protein EVAR_63947_1 [Eumeta japonica]|uniref:Uncharacterized protein n=1 Tax=Eumeta variegata TaxID=151549 RepID=A0A4C1ZNN1_EUMVA|nr:hypothetical protein EVAR_63947_1 [Eumeta japonica]
MQTHCALLTSLHVPLGRRASLVGNSCARGISCLGRVARGPMAENGFSLPAIVERVIGNDELWEAVQTFCEKNLIPEGGGFGEIRYPFTGMR